MKNKRAVEMSMNVLIVAVLVLIILAILAYLLVTRFGWFQNNLKCTEQKGQCVPEATCPNPMGDRYGCSANTVCCPITSPIG